MLCSGRVGSSGTVLREMNMSPDEYESHASNYIGARINTASYPSSLFFF